MAVSGDVKRFLAMAAVFVVTGLGIAYLVIPPPIEEQNRPEPVPELRVAGQTVPMSGDAAANALDLVRRYAHGEITLRFPSGATRKLRRGALGVEIDRVRLADFVKEALRAESAVRREHREKKKGEPLDVPLPIVIDADAATAKLLELKGELDAAAQDAYVDLEKKVLVPEKVGHWLDVYGTIARIDAAFRRGEETVDAAVEVISPRLKADQLGNVKFDQVLGYFETRYSQGERTRDRTYNLRQAASKLDGTVILPGETFDFNGVVGPRDEAHGYRVAPVIAQGELVDGLGGGTCQISGTLHGAAFFAGLEIVERYPHSRPSYYIKLGLDATVVYPTINFRFRNNFDFPIVLHETVAGGVVRAEILGPKRKLTVTYFRRIDEVIPFEQVERQTPKLPEGTKVLAQRGIPGFRTTSSRVVRDGAYAVREKWTDSYPPTQQIINVGTGPSDLKTTGHDDNHPEYTADEYMTVTQGPDIKTPGSTAPEPGGGTVENREPGKTGSQGWYAKAGFPAWELKGDSKEDGDKPAEDGKPDDAANKEKNKDGDKDDKKATAQKGEKGSEPGEQPKKKKKKKKKDPNE
ncbi:MAG: VanW family protein [Polyangiaceae bacterium]|nr:VanW family protein [Polyangiaceae bacterium]